MRIVVSGTHASGKSTLITDFAAVRPDYEVLPDPFEALAETAFDLDAGTFFAQLVIASERQRGRPPGDRVIAVLLPLHHRDPITVGADEDPELRAATDAALLELADDPSLTGEARTIELAGSREDRLARLLEA